MIYKDLAGVLSKGIDFDEFKSGGLRGNHAVAIWDFETVWDMIQGRGKSRQRRRGHNQRYERKGKQN